MKCINDVISVSTNGHADIQDITPDAREILEKTELDYGNVTFFVSGSTAGLTTIEHEPGLVKDFPELFEKLIPSDKRYHHDATWGDGNGHSHLRASLLGPSLVVPFNHGKMLLGTWQQIILVDFDNRSRQRNIVVQVIGE